MIYYAIVVVLICLTYLEWAGEDNNILGSPQLEKYCYVFMATLLTLIAALRYQSDTDWQMYTIAFDHIELELYNGLEAGYVFLCRTFHKFLHSYYIMQFVTAIFYGWVIFHYLYKKSDKPIFTLLLFIPIAFLVVIMTAQRQALAIAIVIIGMRFVEKKKFIPWILMIVLAMQFHITAIVALPLYFTTQYTISKKNALLFFIAVIAMQICGRPLIMAVLKLLSTFQWAPARVLERIMTYTTSKMYGKEIGYRTGLGVIFSYLFNLLVVLLYDEKKDKYMLNFLLAFFCVAIGANFDVLLRLHFYYTICGCGIVVYGLLDRITLPKWASVTKKCDVISCLVIITMYVSFTYLGWFFFFNYTKNQSGRIAKDCYTPYRMWILR